MKIIYNEDIWDYAETSVIGIPTNGFVTGRGKGVMGRGLALQAKQRFPEIEQRLGDLIWSEGNIVGYILDGPVKLLSLPVKPKFLKITHEDDYSKILERVQSKYPIGSNVPGFHCKACPILIEKTLYDLKVFVELNKIPSVHIPLLGCGNGEMNPKDLATILSHVKMPDSITLIYKR